MKALFKVKYNVEVFDNPTPENVNRWMGIFSYNNLVKSFYARFHLTINKWTVSEGSLMM